MSPFPIVHEQKGKYVLLFRFYPFFLWGTEQKIASPNKPKEICRSLYMHINLHNFSAGHSCLLLLSNQSMPHVPRERGWLNVTSSLLLCSYRRILRRASEVFESMERGDHADSGEHVAYDLEHVWYDHVGGYQMTLCGVTTLHYSLWKAVLHVQYLLSRTHHAGGRGSREHVVVCLRRRHARGASYLSLPTCKTLDKAFINTKIIFRLRLWFW